MTPYRGKERNLTFGLNWYLNPNFRWMFNYVRARVEGGELPEDDDYADADIVETRFQIAF